MCDCHSILECCVVFSGVKLSIRSFNLFDSHQSLGRKVQFLNPLGFEPKSAFSHKTCKIKSHSGLQNST